MPPKAKGKAGKGKGVPGPPAGFVPQSSLRVTQKKAVSLSAGVTGQVSSLLQDLSEIAPAASAGISTAKLQARYSRIVDQLLEQGFSLEQVQQALTALPRGSATLESALDWLCLHLPSSELPRSFALAHRSTIYEGGESGGAAIRIVNTAHAGDSARLSDSTSQQQLAGGSDEEEGLVLRPLQSRNVHGSEDEQSDGDGGTPSVTRHGRGDGAASAGGGSSCVSSKAWILQYLQAQGGGDAGGGESDEGDRSDGEASASSASSIEDWELWGDANEVARRKAERARNRVPPEVRRVQIVDEWTKAKEFATAAKAAGNKARQKEAGDLIRELKQEMAKLGMDEASIQRQIAARAAAAAAAAAGEAAAAEMWGAEDASAVKPAVSLRNTPAAVAAAAAAAALVNGSVSTAAGPAATAAAGMAAVPLLWPAVLPPLAGAGAGVAEDEEDEWAVGWLDPTQPLPPSDADTSGRLPPAAGHNAANHSHVSTTNSNGPDPVASAVDDRMADVAIDAEASSKQAVDGHEAGTDVATSGSTPSSSTPLAGPQGITSISPQQTDDSVSGPPAPSATWDPNEMDLFSDTPLPATVTLLEASTGGVPACTSGTTTTSAPATAGPAPLLGWGSYNGSGSGTSGAKRLAKIAASKGGPPRPPSEPPKQPKALLSQACQKAGWPQPRYEKITAGPTGSAGDGGGVVCSAVLDLGPARGAAKKKSGMHGIKVYPAAAPIGFGNGSGGWASTDDAQSAAAARALFELQLIGQPPAVLTEPFRMLLARWQEDSKSGVDAPIDPEVQKQAKLDLVKSLLDPSATPKAMPSSIDAAGSSATAGSGGSAKPATAASTGTRAGGQSLAVDPEFADLVPAAQLVATAAAADDEAAVWAAADNAESAKDSEKDEGTSVDGDVATERSNGGGDEVEEEERAELLDAARGGPLGREDERTEDQKPEDEEAALEERRWRSQQAAGPSQAERRAGEIMRQRLHAWWRTQNGTKMLAARQSLPIHLIRRQVLEAMEVHDVAVVCGDTGCGKTTQVPQYLLEHATESGEGPRCNIVVTQPRRIAAISVAERVAAERGEPPPGTRYSNNGPRHRDSDNGDSGMNVSDELLGTATDESGDASDAGGGSAADDGGSSSSDGSGVASSSGSTSGGRGRSRQGDARGVRGRRGGRGRSSGRGVDPAGSYDDGEGEQGGGGLGSSHTAGGGSGPSTVGYHVRLDAATTRETRLTFCTTGILLRRLASDPTLRGVTHVVVDEVHERSLQSDFLMALLRQLLLSRRAQDDADRAMEHPPPRPPRLKVILMSATLDAQLFAQYFGGCAVLQAEGRTFPVQHLFLEDVYRLTQYKLAPDAPAALRNRGSKGLASFSKQVGSGARGQHELLKEGWGDDMDTSGPLNPNYSPSMYADQPDNVRRNLGRVNEQMIDYDLIEALLQHVDETQPPGAVLIFLPGMGEIGRLYDRLSAQRNYCRGRHWLLPLHSGVSPAEQRRAFQVPPEGVRKVVIATNIAETSLTIEDVVYVIDSGKQKERRFDPARQMSLLVEDWVSRAAALQRKGRAGRVRPGFCYALYTAHRMEMQLRKFQQPEILRVPLEELVLQIHLMQLGPAADFLATVLEPPAPKAIAAALSALQDVGALSLPPDETLTPLGQHLALLPVTPRLGKLLVLGAVCGVLGPAATIAATMSHKSPFVAPQDKQAEAERARRALAAPGAGGIAAGQQSDHLLMVAAYNLWQAALKEGGARQATAVARQHYLHTQTLEALADMRRQFGAMLADVRFVLPKGGDARSGNWLDDAKQTWNRHSNLAAVVKAVLCAALAPNVAVMSDESPPHGTPLWEDVRGEGVFAHPASVVHGLTTPQLQQPFLVYLEQVKTSRVFIRDCTPVSPLSLLLFGGPLTVLHDKGAVLVGGWIRITADSRTAVRIRQIRGALDRVMLEKVKRPDMNLEGLDAQVLKTIVTMLLDEARGGAVGTSG